MSQFMARLASAQRSGEKAIEADEKVMRLINPMLGDEESFWYGRPGVRICKTGTREKIEQAEARPIGKILHGDSEATVVR